MSKTTKKKSKPGTDVSTQLAHVGAQVALPAGVTIKRRITLPSLAIKREGEMRVLAFADAIRVSKVVDKPKDGSKPRDPANIATVGDCLSGEVFIFIVPKVVQSNLERDYPNESYVGCAFQIINKGKRSETQRYNDFEISEVEVDTKALEAARAKAE